MEICAHRPGCSTAVAGRDLGLCLLVAHPNPIKRQQESQHALERHLRLALTRERSADWLAGLELHDDPQAVHGAQPSPSWSGFASVRVIDHVTRRKNDTAHLSASVRSTSRRITAPPARSGGVETGRFEAENAIRQRAVVARAFPKPQLVLSALAWAVAALAGGSDSGRPPDNDQPSQVSCGRVHRQLTSAVGALESPRSATPAAATGQGSHDPPSLQSRQSGLATCCCGPRRCRWPGVRRFGELRVRCGVGLRHAFALPWVGRTTRDSGGETRRYAGFLPRSACCRSWRKARRCRLGIADVLSL